VNALTSVARADTSQAVRGAALRSLARAAPAHVAVNELSRLANTDADAAIRRSAVSALGTVRDERAFSALVALVEKPAGDSVQNATRRQAIATIGRQAGPGGQRQPREIIDLLTRIAKNDADSGVRTAAVDALANLRDARVTPILADLAQNSSDPRVQLRATQGLGRAQPPNDAVEPLRRIAWEHTRLEVQSAAVRALVQIGTEEARRVIAAIAEGHTRPETRRAAVQAVIDQRFVR
jgi:HEAT repeat protein